MAESLFEVAIRRARAHRESRELLSTLVQLLMILEARGLGLGDLERELERQSAQHGPGSGGGCSIRQGHLLIEPGG